MMYCKEKAAKSCTRFLGTRPINQPFSDARPNEISSRWCRIQTAGCSGLDRREPEFFRRDDRANGTNWLAPLAWRLFLGEDFSAMARNQVRNVTERRIRTVSFICAA